MHQSALLKTNQIEKERMAINTRHEDNFNFLFKRKYYLMKKTIATWIEDFFCMENLSLA